MTARWFHSSWFRLAVVRRSEDGGQIALLVIAYTSIAIALVLVVASASAVHLERKRLLGAADGAALDAADEVDAEAYFGTGVEPGSVPLTDASVRARVDEYLSRRGAQTEFGNLTVGPQTGSQDGQTAEVTLYARVDPPFLGWALQGFSDGVLLHATARARVDTG